MSKWSTYASMVDIYIHTYRDKQKLRQSHHLDKDHSNALYLGHTFCHSIGSHAIEWVHIRSYNCNRSESRYRPTEIRKVCESDHVTCRLRQTQLKPLLPKSSTRPKPKPRRQQQHRQCAIQHSNTIIIIIFLVLDDTYTYDKSKYHWSFSCQFSEIVYDSG